MTELETAIEKLKSYRQLHMDAGKRIFFSAGGRISKNDFYPASFIGRSMSFSSAFISLIEAKNYISAVPFIRMQIDNILRFNAAFIVNKPSDFIQEVSKGKAIKDLRSREGKLMKDWYLLERFTTDHPQNAWIKDVYKKSSGYVHFSDIHMDAIFHSKDDDGRVGILLTETVNVSEISYLNAVQAFTGATKILLDFMDVYVYIKDLSFQEYTFSQKALQTRVQNETTTGKPNPKRFEGNDNASHLP